MSTERLNAFRLYLSTLKMIWQEKLHLLRLVSPLLVVALFSLANPFSEIDLILAITLYILGIYCLAISAVQIHVNILEKSPFVGSRIFVRPKPIHFGYLGVLILFQIANGVLVALAEMPLANPLAEIIFIAGGISISIYLIRFYFMLPAITIGNSLSEMLKYTRGRLLRFYLAGILFVLTLTPFLMGAFLFSALFIKEANFLGAAFIILLIMYSCYNVFISVVYREFRGEWLSEHLAVGDN
jgi:hypothetical protein